MAFIYVGVQQEKSRDDFKGSRRIYLLYTILILMVFLKKSKIFIVLVAVLKVKLPSLV